MNIFLFDAFCAILIVAGLTIAFRKSGRQAGSPPSGGGTSDPQVYARRIAGVMLMAFGLAIGVMITAFHYA